MKAFSRHLAATAAILVALHPLSSRSEQPSIDRMALDSGVVAWVSAWNPGDKPFDLKKLEHLYHRSVVTREGARILQTWAEYAAILQPRIDEFVQMTTAPADELQVNFTDHSAETNFVIHPTARRRDGTEVRATSRVRLVWVKDDGMWRISEQQIACSKDSDTGAVATR